MLQLYTVHRFDVGLGTAHEPCAAAGCVSYAAHKAVAGRPGGSYATTWRRLRGQPGGAFEHWLDKPAALEQFCVSGSDGK